jgi:hypothetical protein
MDASDRFSFKRREELDALIDGFDHDLSKRLEQLSAYCNGYADSILSVTGADDDQYVCDRINEVLRKHELMLGATPQHDNSGP